MTFGKQTMGAWLTRARTVNTQQRRGALRRALWWRGHRPLRLEALEDRRLLATFTAVFTGAQENPPVSTSASATAVLQLNPAGNALAYVVNITGVDFVGATTAASDNVTGFHFHQAARGVNGSVVFDILSDDADDLLITANADGTTTVTGVWEDSDGVSVSAFAASLLATTTGADTGLYMNLHTTPHSNGFIRGQLVAAPLTYDASANPAINNVSVQLNATDIEIVETGTANVLALARLASTDRVVIEGADGQDDFVTIDFTGGNPVPAGGLEVHGGTQATTAGDRLAILGTFTTQTLNYALPGPDGNNGSLDLDGADITYTGLEPIAAGNAADTILNLPDGISNNAVLRNNTGAGAIEIVDNGATFEDTVIPSPTNSLTVNLGDAGDMLSLAALDPAFAALLIVNGGASADALNVRATPAATTTTVNAGGGSDTINVSSDAPANLGNLNDIVGALTINGDGGSDALNVSDLGGAVDAAATLSGTQITGLGNAGVITYSVDALNLDLSKGPDTLTVIGTHAGATTIDGNDGADVFHVQSTDGATTINGGGHIDTFNAWSAGSADAGNVDGISGALTVQGDADNDVLIVSDQGGAADAAGMLSATQITGLGNGGAITYGSIDEVTVRLSNDADALTVASTHAGLTRINGNDGMDTVHVQSTTLGSTTNINGGGGGDTVTVGSAAGMLAAIQGIVAFGGGAPGTPPADTLIVSDAGSAAAATYSVQPTGVQKFVGGVTEALIGYSGVETLTLNAGADVDRTFVTAPAGAVTTVNAGAGADQIQLNSAGAGATVQLNGQAGDDVFAIRSTAAGSTTTVSGGDNFDRTRVSSDAAADPLFADNALLGNVNGIAGALTIHGDGGDDWLHVSDRAGAVDTAGLLNATQITGLGNAGAITYTVDFLHLRLSKGPDTLTVTGTHAGTTHIHGNEGADVFDIQAASGQTSVWGSFHNDTFNVSSDAPANMGHLNAITGSLAVRGLDGDDLLNISNRGGAGVTGAALNATQIVDLGTTATITYESLEEVTLDLSDDPDTLTVTGTHAGLTRINGNGGDDIVGVQATSVGSTTNINGGDGDDTVTVGSLSRMLDDIDGVIAFGGGAPDAPTGDTLVIDDANSLTPADSYSVQPTGVQKIVGGVSVVLVGYSGVETLTVHEAAQTAADGTAAEGENAAAAERIGREAAVDRLLAQWLIDGPLQGSPFDAPRL